MAVTTAAIRAPVTLSSVLSHRRRDKFPAINILKKNRLIIKTLPFRSSVKVRALDSQKEQDSAAFTSKEDLGYLLKLGAGSLLGAAAIKYGSVLFPTITKPNIVEALTIIFMPVFVAVLLLFNQSRVKK